MYVFIYMLFSYHLDIYIYLLTQYSCNKSIENMHIYTCIYACVYIYIHIYI